METSSMYISGVHLDMMVFSTVQSCIYIFTCHVCIYMPLNINNQFGDLFYPVPQSNRFDPSDPSLPSDLSCPFQLPISSSYTYLLTHFVLTLRLYLHKPYQTNIFNYNKNLF